MINSIIAPTLNKSRQVVLSVDIFQEQRLHTPDLLAFAVGEVIGSKVPHSVIASALTLVVPMTEESTPFLTSARISVLVLQIEFDI